MKLVSLGEVCAVVNGGTPDTKIPDYWDGPHAWITPAEMGNLNSPFLGTSRRALTDEGLHNSSAQLLPRHSVIMSTRAPIGHLVINEVPMASNQGCKGLIPKSELNYMYLYYFLFANKKYLNSLGSGTTFAELSGTKLKTVKIPLPSLRKQQEIVEKLDSTFAEIELAKSKTIRSIQSVSNLLDSKLDECFVIMDEKWGMVSSGSIIDIRDGTHDSPSYVDSGYPLITSKNLQDGLINLSKVSFIKEEDYHKINKRSKVDVGDLLFAMIGTIGNPVVVIEDPKFAIKNVAIFKGNPKYDMNFLSYFLRSPKIREKFAREAKGTTQRFLGLGYLRTFDIPNVPIKDQLEAVKKLEQFENELKQLKQNFMQRLENFMELRNSILYSCFANNTDEAVV